jgi:phosphatidate cytidylyltransferase
MLVRVITTLVTLPILIGSLFWAGGIPFVAIVLLAALLGLAEFYRGCETQAIRPVRWVGYPAVALLLASAIPWVGTRLGASLEPVLATLVIVGLILEVARSKRAPVANLGATLLGIFYVGWLFRYAILLRVEGGALFAGIEDTQRGVADHYVSLGPDNLASLLVLFVLFTTWACDTGAYFAGRTWGRHKLAPALSPGKTIEGAVGGLAASLLMAALFGLSLHLQLGPTLLLGAVAGTLGQVGDLCESAIKRELGLKDFGALLPGHGGILDRCDSLLFTAPAIYYALALWP